MTCTYEGCTNKVNCRGLCTRHYRMLRGNGLIERVKAAGGTKCECGKPVNSNGRCVACLYRHLNAQGLCTKCRQPSAGWNCEACKKKMRSGGNFIPERRVLVNVEKPKNEPKVYFLTPEELAEINRRYPKGEQTSMRNRNTIKTMRAFL